MITGIQHLLLRCSNSCTGQPLLRCFNSGIHALATTSPAFRTSGRLCRSRRSCGKVAAAHPTEGSLCGLSHPSHVARCSGGRRRSQWLAAHVQHWQFSRRGEPRHRLSAVCVAGRITSTQAAYCAAVGCRPSAPIQAEACRREMGVMSIHCAPLRSVSSRAIKL